MRHAAADGAWPAPVLVGGRPGACGSTLARALAERTGGPCLAKDAVQEILFGALGDEASGGGTARSIGRPAPAHVERTGIR